MDKDRANVLITGGSGFLGRRVLYEIFEGDSPLKPQIVRVLDMAEIPQEYKDRVEFIKGDVRDISVVTKACEDMDVVIHTAAVVDWGVRPESEVLGVNVKGTENMLQACREHNVKYFVHTSSLDAVYNGKALINIDEDQPYPEEHKTTYCTSKHLSEERVLEAHSPELQTVVLRPSDIYGEMDPYHIGSLIDMAKGGFYIRLGNGSSKCQHVYVGNMASSLLQAAASLISKNKKIGGNVYFVTDGKGENFFTFFDQIVRGAGYKIWPTNLWLPRPVAYFLGSVSESIAVLMSPIKKYHPKLSRFAVTYTCTDFTFTSDRAKSDFNYSLKYSVEEAVAKTIAYYREERLKN